MGRRPRPTSHTHHPALGGGEPRARRCRREFSVHGEQFPVGQAKTTRVSHCSRLDRKSALIDTGSHPRRKVYFWLAGAERAITPDTHPREDDSRSCGLCGRRFPGSLVQSWLLYEHHSRPCSGWGVIRPEPARSVLRLLGHVDCQRPLGISWASVVASRP